MHRFYNSLLILATMLLLASCVTETVETTPRMKFSETAVISVQDPHSTIKKGSTIAWLPDAVMFYKDERMKNSSIRKLLEQEIEKNVKARGLTLVESVSGARYAVAYTAALESALDDTDIIRRFGLLPGNTQIPDGDANVEKGTLIVYIFDNSNNEVVWRSAAQVGVHFDMPMEKRKQRIQRILAEMFMTLEVAE